MESLKGHGDGKNYVNAFAFSPKCFVFPQETLHLLTEPLHSLAKCLSNPKTLCIHLQNFSFPWETLRSLAKRLSSLRVSWGSATFLWVNAKVDKIKFIFFHHHASRGSVKYKSKMQIAIDFRPQEELVKTKPKLYLLSSSVI